MNPKECWHLRARDLLVFAIQIGFERTMEQDAAFGLRQLTDSACKALSPAVNDPYTAVQAIDHMAVIFGALAQRPCGDHVAADDGRANPRSCTPCSGCCARPPS